MITNSPARIVQNKVGSPEQIYLQIRPEEILKNIGPEMDLLEKFIIHDIDTDVELLNTVAHHILLAGGKRLRPALVLLASSLFQSIQTAMRPTRPKPGGGVYLPQEGCDGQRYSIIRHRYRYRE